tara:strand:- start:192 stop:605 length:414 start_codon:yes stop_codon:yes gene_type:complete
MAITYQVVYKNHCTPQEQILDGGRFYLDSDCRRKLTGIASVTVAGGPGESGADSGTYNSSTSVSTTAVEVVTAASNADFVFIRNAGSTDVLITLDNSLYYMVLSQGEAFASKIHDDANVKVKTSSGTTTVETLVLIQ